MEMGVSSLSTPSHWDAMRSTGDGHLIEIDISLVIGQWWHIASVYSCSDQCNGKMMKFTELNLKTKKKTPLRTFEMKTKNTPKKRAENCKFPFFIRCVTAV